MKGPIRRGSGDFTGADPRCTEVSEQGARCTEDAGHAGLHGVLPERTERPYLTPSEVRADRVKSAWLQDYERRLALPWWHVDHPRFALRFAYFSVALSAVALALNVGLLLRVW